MKRVANYITLLVALLCTTLSYAANSPERKSEPSDTIVPRFSLLTCSPGPVIYQLFGHTAIRMTTPEFDFVFNYGVFNFEEPNFVYRFVKGDAYYMLDYTSYMAFVYSYERRGSKVVEQNLNLTPQAALKLAHLLMENARPENASYRYDYIYDNCATRPRDIIEAAVGPTLRYGETPGYPETFRSIMNRYTANYPWLTLGIDIALGTGVDYKLPQREMFFIPLIYEDAVAGATYENPTGQRVPLVSSTVEVCPAADFGKILPPTPWYKTPLFCFWLLAIFMLALSIFDIRRRRPTRIVDSLLFLAYSLGGCVVFFLIFISLHSATSPNFVGLWLNPFYVVPAILIWIKKLQPLTARLSMIWGGILLVTLIAMPMLPQQFNAACYPMVLIPLLRFTTYTILFSCRKK